MAGIRRLEVGAALDASLRIYKSRFRQLVVVGAVCYLPYALCTGISSSLTARPPQGAFGSFALFGSALTLLLCMIPAAIGGAAQMHIAHQECQGGGSRLSARESLQAVLPRVASLALTGLCLALGVGLGFVLLVIPGIWFSMASVCALPVCLIEGDGPFASLSRSVQLVRGSWWATWATLALVTIISGLVTWPIAAIVGVLQFWLKGHVGSPMMFYPTSIAVQLVGLAPSFLTAPLAAIAVVVVYYHLRDSAEGYDLERMVEQAETPPGASQ